MNKVFKVIWSKTKNCYVVASELAKTHTKAPKSSIISRTLVAGVLACVIGAGIVAPVYADGTDDNTFTISVPKSSGAEDVYNFNLADDLGVTVDNTVTSYDGIQTFANSSNNLQSVIDGNMSRLSTIYQGDGQRGLYDGDAGVFKRDGNFLMYEATHNGPNNNGLVVQYSGGGTGNNITTIDYSDLSSIDLSQALELLYNHRYDSPQGAASALEQRFGANNVLSTLLRLEYTETGKNYLSLILNNNANAVPNSGYGNAIRGGTSGLYADLKELVDVLTYDEHKSDLALNVNNLDVNNTQGNTIVGTGTVSGTNSISVGAGHQITGSNSGAFGDPTIINGDNSYSVGNNNAIAQDTSDVFVLGNNVNATASDVVALGSGSSANQEHTVSVGNATTKRRIVNVADGVANSDAATVGQLRDAISATGGIHGVGIANISENATNYNGEGAIGYDSVAIGDAKAAGAGSVAVGSRALTTGTNSVAIGTNATATGDGTTREEIDAILANNKAIRDTLNDARADYTASKAEYDRQREIWEGQNEAYARVQAANQTIAGYQDEINSTLQPNADSANNAYNQAKDAYDTLYNDFANRLEVIKRIDFSLYANTSTGVIDLDAMATDLKSQTESGTSFNMPVEFYRNYIDNYIKAEGNLRDNISFYNSISSNTRDTKYNNIESSALEGTHVHVSLSNNFCNEDNYRKLVNDDNAVYNPDIKKVLHSDYNYMDIYSDGYRQSSISNSLSVKSPFFNFTINGANILNDNDFANRITEIDNQIDSYLNYDYSTATNWSDVYKIYNAAVDMGFITNEQRADALEKIKFNSEKLESARNLLKYIANIYHEQYLYEKYRDEGNNSEALVHLGNKENFTSLQSQELNNYKNLHWFKDYRVLCPYDYDYYVFFINPNGTQDDYNAFVQEYVEENENIGTGTSQATYFSLDMPYMYDIQHAVVDPLGNWIYNELYNPVYDTNIVLKSLEDGLDGQLVNLRQQLDEATQAKEQADQALANKQQQIADTTPSQQDLDDAAAAEASAQDLAQKEAKLQADEEALEQAKANLQNLETIATDGESAIAIGGNAVTTAKNGIGIGTDALVTGEEAIGIGKNAIASGKNSIAIGTDNSVSSANSIVIGTNNGVTGMNSIAIGNNNVISGQNSVAIGNNLSVTEDNVVLLGTRRVTGVVDGQSATDAATVGQTFELVAGSGMTVEEDGVNAIGQKKYRLNSTATGGATYVSGDNIVIEDDVISAQGLIKYDGADKKVATLEGGTRGTKLTNLATATLTRTSTDAVVGAQLWATNSNLAGMQTDITTNANNISSLTSGLTSVNSAVAANSVTIDTLDDLKADKNLTNLTDVGRQVISAAAANAVQEYMATNGGNGGATGNSLLGGTNTLSASRPMGFGLMANPLGNSSDDIIVSNNDDMNNGNDISMEVQAALDDKANISLDNINDAGISVIRDALADDLSLKADKDSVYTKDETDGLLDAKADLIYVNSALDLKADKDSVYSKSETDDLLGTKADITYVDEGLDAKADKSTVYTKEETDSFLDAKADKSALDAKANADGSNIDADAWSKVLATGQVLPNDTGLVNGGTVFNSMMAVAQSNPVQAGEDTIFIGKQEKYDAVKAIDISNSKGEARVMTGVIANPQDMSSAANVGYVNAVGESIMGNINGRFSEVNEKISDVGANAAAMSALVPMTPDGDEKWALSAAVGHYDSSTASAVGLFYKPSDKVIVNVKGTVGSDKNMLAGGVTVALDKGSTPGVSKAQMVKTINAQAERIAKLEQVVNQLAQEKAQQ